RMREGVAVIQQDVGAYVAEIRGRGFLLGLDFDLAGHGVEIPLTHVIDLANVGNMDASLAALSDKERRRFIDQFGDVAEPVVYLEQEVEGIGGERILLEVHGIMRTTDFFEQSLRRRNFDALNEVRSAVSLAARRGSAVAGLGQFTSIVSSNGLLVKDYGPAITTGNSLTAGFAFETLLKALHARGVELGECRVGVVGAAGNICNVLAQLIGDNAKALTLVHRSGDDATRRMLNAKGRILAESRIDASSVRVSSNVADLADCDAIILGTSTTEILITPEILKRDAVIIDISVPSNVDPAVFLQRPDVAAYHGALAQLPNSQSLATDWLPRPRGQVYACLAETITLGFSGHVGHFSLGQLRKSQVVEVLQLAGRVGLEMGRPVPLRMRSH
ncbi:MAG: hypothetical protein ABIT38_24060, partial [Gemmatimonadaceae bacterium]